MSPRAPLVWPTQALSEALTAVWPAAQVEVVQSVTSTNTVLMNWARAAGPEGVPRLLVAEAQTAGRGRLGRTWLAQPGASLTFSLALPLAPTDWSGLSLAVGVALAEALDPCATPLSAQTPVARIGLKWPNDLWLLDPQAPGRKLGGILVETVVVGTLRWMVLGVGLNVHPQEGAAPAGVRPACLAEWLPDITVPAALTCVLLPLAQALKQFESAGFAPFVPRYAARDLLHGRMLTLSHHPELTHGLAEGITHEGALRVRSAQGISLIHSGEVSVRPCEPEFVPIAPLEDAA